MASFEFQQIGIVESPYKEKFSIPRQPRLAPDIRGKILLVGEFNNPDYLRELQQFSHIWILFIFHRHLDKQAKPLVRPPRFTGKEKVGVFASRSTFRPNPIGMSAVKLENLITSNGQSYLEISGLDLLDGTPVIDIKPYVPYSDQIELAYAGYAETEPDIVPVNLSDSCQRTIEKLEADYPNLKQILISVIQQNPTPIYKKGAEKNYGTRLYDLEVRWTLSAGECVITEIIKS